MHTVDQHVLVQVLHTLFLEKLHLVLAVVLDQQRPIDRVEGVL